MSGLLALLPGRTSTPSFPPFNAASRLSRRNRLLGFSGPWQRRQVACRIGFTSRAKSTWSDAGGGSLDSSTASAESRRLSAEENRHPAMPHAHIKRRFPGESSMLPRRFAGLSIGRSVKVIGLGVGTVDRYVATGGPTSAEAQVLKMILLADVKTSSRGGWSLHLGVATEAQVRITRGQQFGVDGAMRAVAGHATFTQRRVFENYRLGLFPMALGAGLVQAGHRESARRFHDVLAVGIMELHTVHLAFDDGMVLGQMEFSADFR